MDVMKKVLFWMALTILSSLGLSVSPALADGVHGVRETAREILVDVPKFCRPLKVVWEVVWERNDDNKDLMFSFIKRDEKKMKVLSYQRGAYRVETIWRGGEVVRIPKFDSKGHPIRVKILSILAQGEEGGVLSDDNWLYESQNDRWVNGATVSPLVRDGTWGGRCT